MVVPIIYSFAKPLGRPRRAVLIICGSQIEEYVTATNIIDRVGESITRTISVKKMKRVISGSKNELRRVIRLNIHTQSSLRIGTSVMDEESEKGRLSCGR
jgi:hypothetical protein